APHRPHSSALPHGPAPAHLSTLSLHDALPILNAAGPWAKAVAAMAGVHVPIEPVRRHLLLTGPCAARPSSIPMTIDDGRAAQGADRKSTRLHSTHCPTSYSRFPLTNTNTTPHL